MDLTQFQAACDYVGFDATSADALRRFLPLAAPAFDAIVEDFYDTILAHPHSRAALTGGERQVLRLKQTLGKWLTTGLSGPHDEQYLQARRRIGEVHVNIHLPQELMFTAMNRVRRALLQHAKATLQGEALDRTEGAIEQWLDLELAIMLDSYREHWAARVRAGERLATIGQFAAAIGHEMRNPLSVIETSTAIIAQRMEQLGVSDESISKHRQRILRQLVECTETIDDLLQLARETPPHSSSVSLREVVQAAVNSVGPAAEVEVEVRVGASLSVHADPVQLRQVVANLVQNAVQALNGKGRVEIDAQASDDGVELWVNDDGPGVADAIRSRVFDLWFSTKSNGTGLGLALAKKLVEGHGGQLSLEPSSRGARFRIWLPRTAA